MESLVHNSLLIVACIFVAFCAKYAVTFVLKIRKPRGQDLEITTQIPVDADNPTEAMKKAYQVLPKEQKEQVIKVFLSRTDEEGK